jgi:predicted MFS family arabinose efflux permease
MGSDPGVRERTSRLGYAHYVVVLLMLVNMANYGQRSILGVLAPAIQQDLRLSDTELGLLTGGVFGLSYALVVIPLSRLGDGSDRRVWIALMVAAFSLATLLIGRAHSFAQIFVARIGVSVAQASVIPSANALIAAYVPGRHRVTALALHSLGGVIGIAFAAAAGGYLASVHGWRTTMLLLGAGGIALAVIVAVTLRDPRANRPLEFRRVTMSGEVGHLLHDPIFRLATIAFCLSVWVDAGLNQWLPSYYVRALDMPIEQAGRIYGTALFVGGVPGTLVGALIAARLMSRDRRWLTWLPACCNLLAIVAAAIMLTTTTALQVGLANVIYAFLVYAPGGCMWGALLLNAPPDLRGTASAIALAASGLTGLTAGPGLVGILSDLLSSSVGADSLRIALLANQMLLIPLVIVLLCTAAKLPPGSVVNGGTSVKSI